MASCAYCPCCGATNPHNRNSCKVCKTKITPTKTNPAYDSLSDTRDKAAIFDINMTLLNTSERHRSAIRAGLEDKNGNAIKKSTIESLSKAQNRLNDFLHEDKHLSKDTVVPGAKTLVDHFAADGYTIIYCTNRPVKYKEATRLQLENKGFPVYNDSVGDPLIFLRSGSGSKSVYKRDVFIAQRAKYDVQYVFDDSNKVLNEAAQLGIPGLYTTVKAYLDIINPRSEKKNPIEIDKRSGYAFSTLEDPEEAYKELVEYHDSLPNPPPEPRKKSGRKEPSKIYQQRMAWSDKKMRKEFPDDKQRIAVSLNLVEKFYGKAARVRITAKWNPRVNPANPSKVEKGKKLYEHMNKVKPEKIETKQIDIGDVWYQVGEGGCWQIGYMSGKETNKKDQKYNHIFNEESKDGNFPKLYATIPDKGKPMLIITGGTWKIKTDDTNTAWIYD